MTSDTCVTGVIQGTAAVAEFDLLAVAMDYPTAVVREALAAAMSTPSSAGGWGKLAAGLGELRAWLSTARAGEPEERYTQLFDLRPVSTLNIGYHLFGDTYARGAFLAQLNRELAVAGVSTGKDLPDYLPTLLRLLPRLQDPEDQFLLVHSVLIPGLRRMGERLESSIGPYPALLIALPTWLEELVPAGDREVLVPPLPEEEEATPCSM